MTASSRTDKLFSALSAKERAILVLRAWKEGGEEDPAVRRMIPDSQVHEFNRYIALMNACNEGLGPWVLVIRSNVEQLGLISGWLATTKVWSMDMFSLSYFIFCTVPEPIAETEYKKLKKGKREPRPDRGLRYEVYPDAKAKEVERLRADLASVWEVFARTPHLGIAEDLGRKKPRLEQAFEAFLDRLARQVPDYWRETRAVEMLLEEAREAFGEDAAIPELREIVDWLRQQLTELHEMLKDSYQREVELLDPDEARVDSIRKIADWPEATASSPVTVTL